jgi:hypothetical protein
MKFYSFFVSEEGLAMLVASCCWSAAQLMTSAFDISPTSTNRVFVGWAASMADSQHNVDWTTRLFNALVSGRTIVGAIEVADMIAKAKEANGQNAECQKIGDIRYKMHGLYPNDMDTNWYLHQ